MMTLACSIQPVLAPLETQIDLHRAWPARPSPIYAPRLRRPLLLTLLLTLALLLALVGCGSPGTPQPPSLKLPTPPADLTASRSGNSVTLHWTMPRRATDRALLSGDQRVVICRNLGADNLATGNLATGNRGSSGTACNPVGAVLLAAGQPASYTDILSPLLVAGPPRLLTYTVQLENHKQRSAGLSNPAYSAAGAPPPAIDSLSAQATSSGIVLHWPSQSAVREAGALAGGSTSPPEGSAPRADGFAPLEARYLFRLQRTRIFAQGESANPTTEETRAGVPQPIEQTLEVPQVAHPTSGGTMAGGWTLDHAVDTDAMLNRTYQYTVERVARLKLDGHIVEVSSRVSAPATIVARDIFPPAVPQGLEAVADSQGGAIDLSWTANTDVDLAGYRVYRRVTASSEPAVQVSGTALLPNPAWRDTSVRPGVRYAYSVSATDKSGNESVRSPEVMETLSD